MDDDLRAWVEATVGGRVVSATRPDDGGSREQYFVTVAVGGSEQQLVLRCEAGSSFTGTAINPTKEAVVYRALAGTGVPVPRVVGVAPDGAALLMERVPGTGEFADLPADERQAVTADFVDVLARLHSLDVDALDLDGFPHPLTVADHARVDLSQWHDLADHHVDELPALARFAGAWLLAHPPDHVGRTVLVQGDTGPGNFVSQGGRVTALVDWEFGHIGDPMDDWAWLDMRMRGDWPERPALVARYEAATGLRVDEASVLYYAVAVRYRCIVTTSMAVTRGGGARGFAPYLLVTQRFLAELAALLRLAVPAERAEPADPTDVGQPAPERTPTERSSWYDRLGEAVRAAARALPESELRDQTRNAQILVRYLKAYDEIGSTLAARDEADRARLPGRAGRGPLTPDEIEAAGRAADQDVLAYLLRQAQREAELWADQLARPRR